MTRLTKAMKEVICDNAIKQSPVSKELKEVLNGLSDLAQDIYNDNVTTEQINTANKIQSEIEKLPFDHIFCDKWFCKEKYIYVNLGGARGHLPLHDKLPRLMETPTYVASHEFSIRYLELENKRESLIRQRDNLEIEIMSILDSCTSLKKLAQVWAESVNFLGGIPVNISSANLPAITVEDLNKKLGISS